MPTCTSRASGRRHGLVAAIGLVAFVGPVAALALPDEAPWGRADGEACHDCHFLNPVVESSEALAIEGLPARFAPGETYRLVLELAAPEMRLAGFRVIANASGEGSPGRFEAVDATTEADGDRIRSTLAGSELDEPGAARWTFVWHAPESGPPDSIELDVSANAADDDASPLGDVIHSKSISLRPGKP